MKNTDLTTRVEQDILKTNDVESFLSYNQLISLHAAGRLEQMSVNISVTEFYDWGGVVIHGLTTFREFEILKVNHVDANTWEPSINVKVRYHNTELKLWFSYFDFCWPTNMCDSIEWRARTNVQAVIWIGFPKVKTNNESGGSK